jgi:hypothetical protein
MDADFEVKIEKLCKAARYGIVAYINGTLMLFHLTARGCPRVATRGYGISPPYLALTPPQTTIRESGFLLPCPQGHRKVCDHY